MISRTAKILASRRALELEKEHPLIRDQFSRLFTDSKSMAFASKTKNEIHYVLMRHRILDDLVALNHGRFKQIVILGCGFDTKSLRYSGRGVRFLEVDSPAVIKHKKKVLDNHGYDLVETHEAEISSPGGLRLVIQHTDPSLPTLVIAEGFFMYLDPEVALGSFSLLTEYYGRNMVTGFDTLSTEYAKSRKNQEALQRLKDQGGEVVKFFASSRELKKHFSASGYNTETWTPDELQKKYYGSAWTQNNDKFVSVAAHHSFNYRI